MRTLMASVIAAALLPGSAWDPSFQPAKQYDDMWPAWSPDGRHIVYVSTRDGDPEIYVMKADGTEPRRLTTAQGRDAHPFWSPDGTQIVFQSPREDGHTRIFLMNADGSNQRPLTENTGFCGVPTWSPDGRWIVYQCTDDLARVGTDSQWHLFVIDAKGGARRQITYGAANDQVPNWAPDSTRLVFHSDRSGIDQLYIMNVAGGPATAMTSSPDPSRSASWSPDGQRLFFHSARAGRPSDIYSMPSRGGDAVRLTMTSPQHGVPYASPDGHTIVFQARAEEGSWRIWVMNHDGSDPRQLGTRPASVKNSGGHVLVSYSAENVVALISPDTRVVVATFAVAKDPHEITVSRDGSRAYVATTGGGAGAPAGGPNVITPLDLVTREPGPHLDLGRCERPHDVRVSADGTALWIACAPAQAVVEVDARTGRFRTSWNTRADGGWFLAATPDDRKIYVPHLEGKRVSVIDRASGGVSTVLTGGAQSGIDVSPDGRTVWAIDHEQRRINVVDTATDRVVADVPLRTADFGRLRFSPDGQRVILVQRRTLTLLNATTRHAIGTVEIPYDGKVVDVSPSGDRAVVSNPADNRITIVDLKALTIVTTIPTGKGPDGVAWIR
jgi:Tol biopolymer transport system component